MRPHEIELASLLCSRLCHDMLSPIGALNNGIELLADEEDPEMRQQCINLLADSARVSAQKLTFFRLAFGAAGGFDESIDMREPKALIEGLLAQKPRIAFEWHVASDSLAKPAVKIVLNLALICIDALVRGGTLTIAAEQHGQSCDIAVRADGPKVVVDSAITDALTGSVPFAQIGPKSAPAYMIERIADQHKATFQVAHEPDALIIGTTLKL